MDGILTDAKLLGALWNFSKVLFGFLICLGVMWGFNKYNKKMASKDDVKKIDKKVEEKISSLEKVIIESNNQLQEERKKDFKKFGEHVKTFGQIAKDLQESIQYLSKNFSDQMKIVESKTSDNRASIAKLEGRLTSKA
jgi:hypothetical protein